MQLLDCCWKLSKWRSSGKYFLKTSGTTSSLRHQHKQRWHICRAQWKSLGTPGQGLVFDSKRGKFGIKLIWYQNIAECKARMWRYLRKTVTCLQLFMLQDQGQISIKSLFAFRFWKETTKVEANVTAAHWCFFVPSFLFSFSFSLFSPWKVCLAHLWLELIENAHSW